MGAVYIASAAFALIAAGPGRATPGRAPIPRAGSRPIPALTAARAQVSPGANAGLADDSASRRTPPPIPSPFLRLYSMLAFSALAYIPQWVFGDRKDYSMALRHGMAGGFVLSGIDHFVTTQTRYMPMLPSFLTPHGVGLIYATGVLELAGAVGLVVPLAVYRRLGLPNLRKWAGIGLAILLAALMVANVHVAVLATGGGVFADAWIYWLRLLFQPVFMVWALYAGGVIRRGPGVASPEAPVRGGVV